MEGHTVFPDPDPTNHPEPLTTGQRIALARFDLVENFVWDIRPDGKIYCHACAPGGYLLRSDASPETHAESKNPPTHKHNMVWLTVQSFIHRGEPVPSWPEAYDRQRNGLAYCLFCLTRIGLYDEATCTAHDAYHMAMHQKIMRPSRLAPGTQAIRELNRTAVQRPRKRHYMDEVIEARLNMDAPVYRDNKPFDPSQPWEPTAKPETHEYTHRDLLRNMDRQIMRDKLLHGSIILDGEEILNTTLDSIVTHEGKRMSWACAVKNLHEGLLPRECQKASECQCYCHQPIGGATP